MRGPKPLNIVDGDLIVAEHLHVERRIDLTQSLDEVIGEGIVVVDEHNHASVRYDLVRPGLRNSYSDTNVDGWGSRFTSGNTWG